MSNTGEGNAAKALAEIQATMQPFREELMMRIY